MEMASLLLACYFAGAVLGAIKNLVTEGGAS